MPINANIPLMAAQPVAGVRDAWANGSNEYYKAKDNTRQNALLQMRTQTHEADQERHDLEMETQRGQILYKGITGLSKLTPEQRRAQIDLMKPKLEEYGFDDDDWAQLETDEGLAMAGEYFSKYMPTPSSQEALRREELSIKRERLEHDKILAERELEGLHKTIDSLDIPDKDKSALKNLPKSSLEKVVEKQLDPKTKANQDEALQQQKTTEELKQKALGLVNELLDNEDGVKSILGGIDSITPTFLDSSKDAEAALEDLKNTLTVPNLKMIPGILSDSDIRVIQSVAGEGLSGSQDRVLRNLRKLQATLGGEQAAPDQQSTGRFKVRVRSR